MTIILRLDWITRLLLLISVVLLFWSNSQMLSFLINRLLPTIAAPRPHELRLFYILFSLSTVLLGVLSLVMSCILLALVIGRPVHIPSAWKRIRRGMTFLQRRILLYTPLQRHILLAGGIGTFYILFLQENITWTLLWTVCIVLGIFISSWEKIWNLSVVCILCIMLLILTIHLYMQQNYSLLNTGPPFLYSTMVPFLLVAYWGYFNWNKYSRKGEEQLLRFFVFLLLFAGLLSFYGNTVLTTVNCHYAKYSRAVYIPAQVEKKCPVLDNSYTLSISYMEGDRRRGTLIPVNPLLYDHVKEGDSLQLHMHSGRLGWDWYHSDIHKRVQRSLIPDEELHRYRPLRKP